LQDMVSRVRHNSESIDFRNYETTPHSCKLNRAINIHWSISPRS
jgi:hypothetical protein